MTKQQIGRCCVCLFSAQAHTTLHRNQKSNSMSRAAESKRACSRLGRRYSGYKFRSSAGQKKREPGALIPTVRCDASQPNLPLLLEIYYNQRATSTQNVG
jgi:hypothetical protein